MNVAAVVLLVLSAILGWTLQLVNLGGNWLIVAAAALYAWWTPEDAPAAIGWNTVVALVLLAALGEIVELVASALGVTKAGGSRRAAVLAILGSVLGSVLGIFVGLPIPLVGSLLAAVVFGGAGALVGAMLGESWKGRDFDASLDVGVAAFVGRIAGTLAKMVVSSTMVAVLLAALVL